MKIMQTAEWNGDYCKLIRVTKCERTSFGHENFQLEDSESIICSCENLKKKHCIYTVFLESATDDNFTKCGCYFPGCENCYCYHCETDIGQKRFNRGDGCGCFNDETDEEENDNSETDDGGKDSEDEDYETDEEENDNSETDDGGKDSENKDGSGCVCENGNYECDCFDS
jgi:hypothetical protein